MKKTLLLSVVASTMIMAGGNIAPVEPVVEAPVVVPASDWDFAGKSVVYYQTTNLPVTTGKLFKKASSAADAGFQLNAVNKDVVGGIGMGVTLNGLATLNLENNLVSGVMQSDKGAIQGGWIGELYATYGMGNTSLKLGRQTLPAGLSPFAHSEGWNVFENTYDAALVVNSSIPNTTLVYAWVFNSNQNGYANIGGLNPVTGLTYGDMSTFGQVNKKNGVHMITVQNKSVSNLTLTGSYYYGKDKISTGNALSIIWADAAYKAGSFNIAAQGGQVSDSSAGFNKTTAYGVKVGASFAGINAHAAYSSVNKSTLGVFNVGGQQTALYTQMIFNEGANSNDNKTWVVAANTALLGGTFGAAYGSSKNGTTSVDTKEADVYYTADMIGGNYLFGYVNQKTGTASATNIVRVVARYKF